MKITTITCYCRPNGIGNILVDIKVILPIIKYKEYIIIYYTYI